MIPVQALNVTTGLQFYTTKKCITKKYENRKNQRAILGYCCRHLCSEWIQKKNKYPEIISAHPIGSYKDQTSGEIYRKRLAEKSYVVIAFDASFQGARDGQPRFIEEPTLRVEDFRIVANYLVTLPYVMKTALVFLESVAVGVIPSMQR